MNREVRKGREENKELKKGNAQQKTLSFLLRSLKIFAPFAYFAV
jgi:hypothetical protein